MSKNIIITGQIIVIKTEMLFS